MSAASTLGSGLDEESSHSEGVGLSGGVGILPIDGRRLGDTAVQSTLDVDLKVVGPEVDGRLVSDRKSLRGEPAAGGELTFPGAHGFAYSDVVQAADVSFLVVRSCENEVAC